MEVVKVFPPQIKTWKHMPVENFANDLETPAEEYTLEITPPEPGDKDIVYFNITITKKIINQPYLSVPFAGSIYYHYKVKTDYELPTSEFFFSLVNDAASNFAVYFLYQNRKTNLVGFKVLKPSFESLKDNIQNAIDTWVTLHKPSSTK